MITLYHAAQSRSSRVIWLLEELGATYNIRPVTIFRPGTGEGVPDPANPHPDKQVPAITHEGALIAESVAIVLYLTDAFPQADLGPVAGDRRRGEYLTWLAWYAAALEPATVSAIRGELAEEPMKQRAYDGVVRRLDDRLSQDPFVLGDAFSGADILISSAIGWARQAFPDSAILDAYVARCQARPAALRAIELDEGCGLQRAA